MQLFAPKFVGISAHIRRFTQLHLRSQLAAVGVFAVGVAGVLSLTSDNVKSMLQPHRHCSAQLISIKAAAICNLFTGDEKNFSAPILGSQPMFNSLYHRKGTPVWKVFGDSGGRQVDLMFDDDTGRLACYSIQIDRKPRVSRAKYLRTPVEAAAHADRFLRDLNILPRHGTIALEAMPQPVLKGEGWRMVWNVRQDASTPLTKIKVVLESSDGAPLLIMNPYLPFASH